MLALGIMAIALTTVGCCHLWLGIGFARSRWALGFRFKAVFRVNSPIYFWVLVVFQLIVGAAWLGFAGAIVSSALDEPNLAPESSWTWVGPAWAVALATGMLIYVFSIAPHGRLRK